MGVDTKGAPALLPARIKLSYEKDEAKAKAVLAAEAAVPTREQRHALDPTGAYSAAQPFWAHIAGARWGCGHGAGSLSVRAAQHEIWGPQCTGPVGCGTRRAERLCTCSPPA